MTAQGWRPNAPGWAAVEPDTTPDDTPTVPADRSKCGTYGGAQAHKRRDEPVCTPCREARNAYMADWRRRNPDKNSDAMRTQHARDRALRKLADQFPHEFNALYMAELNQMSTGAGVAS